MTVATANIRTAAETALIEAFDDVKTALPGGSERLFAREAAFGAIRANGLPNRRVEAYKYTDLKALYGRQAPVDGAIAGAGSAAALPPDTWSGVDRSVIAFENGRALMPAGSASLPEGVVCAPYLEAAEATGFAGDYPAANGDPILALNGAFTTDGVALTIGAAASEPVVEILHLSTASAPADTVATHRIRVETGVKATVLVTYLSDGEPVTRENVAFEVDVERDAELTFVSRQQHAESVTHFATLRAGLGERAKLDLFNLCMGAGQSRQQNFIGFFGETASVVQRTISLVGDGQQADVVHAIDHRLMNCDSKDFHRVAADGRGRSVYQGLITVRPDAQHTDGRMMTKSLLLSDEAEAIAKPELEIFADDVQCAHGATSGQLDETQIFYLMSRGIGRREAEHLLLSAFLNEVIEDCGEGAIADNLLSAVDAWLERRWSLNEEAAA